MWYGGASFGFMPRSGIAESWVELFPGFWETAKLIVKVVVQVCTPTSNEEVFPLLQILTCLALYLILKLDYFVCWCLISWVLYIFWSIRCRVGEDLFPFCRLPLFAFHGVLCLTEAFQFHKVPFINCWSLCLSFWCSVQEVVSCGSEFKTIPHYFPQGSRLLHCCSLPLGHLKVPTYFFWFLIYNHYQAWETSTKVVGYRNTSVFLNSMSSFFVLFQSLKVELYH